MIDYDDVETVTWAGPAGVLGLVLVIILLGIAMCNDDECSRKACPGGGSPRLLDHACLCVERAR